MATLTSNISNVSLTVSGNTQQSTTISWSLPSVPNGATITSCTLTGTATASMSKGSATITVNGQTVSSGSNFTINLGTGNTTSSVTATAQGGNKNARGTVTFSNLVYTITYPANYIVTFVDWDGAVLKTETVTEGNSATAPTSPIRDRYIFTGWDKSFSSITSDLTITAQYEQIIYYTVTFLDYDGTILKIQEVEKGSSAAAPETYRYGYESTGWSVDFSNVTSNITTMAQYIAINTFSVKEDGNWTNIIKIFKKINGIWVEQNNNDWTSIFDASVRYVGKEKPVTPSAILYSDGYMIFLDDEIIDYSHGDIVGVYTGWDINHYTALYEIPWYNSRSSIINVLFNSESTKPISMCDWFHNCYNLTSLDLSSFNTSNVTDMSSMFSGCTDLISLDLSSFDTSNVTDMDSMFGNCSSLTSLDLSSFDTSNVTNMVSMFYKCSSLTSLDLSSFNTSNVITPNSMFYGCTDLTSIDLSSFDTSNVTDMSNMFSNCSSLTSIDLSSFDTSNVTNMTYMFYGCTDLISINLSSFNTSNVTQIGSMFYNCSSLIELDISNFDMANVANEVSMFKGCTNLQTIYVKDETAKTKIETSTGFPSTATVIIGNPT